MSQENEKVNARTKSGAPERTRSVRVVLIHGFNGNPRVFKDIKKNLEELGAIVETIRYDSNKTFSSWIKMIDSKISKHNPEELYIIGHSLGGSLALYLSQKYKFKGLVTINSPVYLRKHILIKVLTKIIRRFKKVKKVAVRDVKYSLDSVVSLFDFLNSIGTMKVDSLQSALIIQSRKDGIVNPKSARIIYERINISQKQLINVGQGHSPLDQQPVINAILGFLGLV